MKLGLIYKHTSPSGRSYIGKTSQGMITRFKSHIKASEDLNNNGKFVRAIRKYGYENFTSEVLVDNVPEMFLNGFEIYWIAHFDTFENGYNMTVGGDGITNMSDEIKQKISDTKMNKSDSDKKAYSEKLSVITTNLWNDDEYRKKQIAKKVGRKLSKSHKDNLSTSLKGKRKPPGFRVGSKHSDETKKKLSVAKSGMNNPGFKPLTIYKNDGVPVVTILYRYRETCQELNLPPSICKTHINNSTLYESTNASNIQRLTDKGWYKYRGWYARLAKKCQ